MAHSYLPVAPALLTLTLAFTGCATAAGPDGEPDAGSPPALGDTDAASHGNLGTPVRLGDAGDIPAAHDAGVDSASTSVSDAGTDTSPGEPDAGAVPVDAASPDTGGAVDAAPGPPCPMGVDLDQMTLYSNPPDLATWPITTTLTEVDFTNDGVAPQFSKMDGTGRWPDVVPPGWGGPLQYTIGMVECIEGQWYTSAVIEVWYGLAAAGGNVAMNDQVAMNWYYDAGRWGLLAGRQPATGETIGIFVAAGNLRNITADDPAQSPVMERSNVVFMPMPDVNGSTNSF